MNIMRLGAEALDITKTYLTSSLESSKHEELFKDLETYCMFLGYPRSGHSLVGSLLDAHPNMVIAHELDALKYIQARFSDKQIYYLLSEKSRDFTENGRAWNGFLYQVPNQWQGRFEKLKVIGDKKGGGSTQRLRDNPDLLRRMRNTIKLKIKFVHITRNPYDNISTITLKTQQDNFNLTGGIEFYFSLCKTIAEIKKQINSDDLFEAKHESFIDDPQPVLKRLCNFLGVEASDGYLNDCASVVFKSPHQSRHDVTWTPELIDRVKKRIDQFDFLDGYTYEN